MNTALRICQQRYDDLLPDDTPAFLDTSEGANWLADAGEQLVQGKDVQIGNLIAVQACELSDAVAIEAIRRVEEHQDEEGMLGRLLVAVDNYDIAEASACLKSLFSDQRGPNGVFRKMAEDLVVPFADSAAAQMQRDAEQDAIEMRTAG